MCGVLILSVTKYNTLYELEFWGGHADKQRVAVVKLPVGNAAERILPAPALRLINFTQSK